MVDPEIYNTRTIYSVPLLAEERFTHVRKDVQSRNPANDAKYELSPRKNSEVDKNSSASPSARLAVVLLVVASGFDEVGIAKPPVSRS